MKKQIITASLMGLIALVAFNNCGEGFQSIEVGSSGFNEVSQFPPQSSGDLSNKWLGRTRPLLF